MVYFYKPKTKWTRAYPIQPTAHLIAHRDALLKQPFRPSYDGDGDPKIGCLLNWSYFRIWQQERTKFVITNQPPPKPAAKQFPIYSNRKPSHSCGACIATEPVKPIRRPFCHVAAKVDHRGIDIARRRREQQKCQLLNQTACCQ